MRTLRRHHLALLACTLGTLVAGCTPPAPSTNVAAVDAGAPSASSDQPGWEMVDAILARIQAPTFPDRVVSIVDHGAIADGTTPATAAIRAAIEACHAAGGGRVLVPAGDFLTGPIRLLSNVELHLVEDATLRFSTNPADYLPAVLTRWEGLELYNYSPLIYAHEAENIAVTGKGTLDGQGEPWWPWKGRWKHRQDWATHPQQQREARDRLIAQARDGVPVDQRVYGEGDFLRPNLFAPHSCRNVLIEGVTVRNSPMWHLNPVLCTNVIVRGVTIVGHGPNNDGCNPESCTDVLIEDCFFDTGDDCIAIKSGRNEDGRRVGVPSSNLIIRNCTMKDGHGGVVIGSEISGGCRNVFVENCTMDSPNLDRALRLKTNSYRGGTIENVFMRNVRIGQVRQAVVLCDFFYEEGAGGGHDPVVRNIVIENVTAGKSMHPLFLRGYESSPITDVVVRNSRFEGVSHPSVISHVKGLVFDNVFQNTGSKTDEWGNPVP
jgi:polygalacturonase